jgi:hypothetical protein
LDELKINILIDTCDNVLFSEKFKQIVVTMYLDYIITNLLSPSMRKLNDFILANYDTILHETVKIYKVVVEGDIQLILKNKNCL